MRRCLVLVSLVAACSNEPPPAAVQADGASVYGGVRLSAPIVPDATFSAFGDPNAYAKLSVDDKRALVEQHTFSFAQLLTTCATSDPTIVPDPSTQGQYDANYAAVAACAYDTLGMSPTWVPQLVVDVDVCSVKYPDASWHEPTTSEMVTLPTGFPTKLEQAIAKTGVTQATFASLRIYGVSGPHVEIVDADAEPVSLTVLQLPTTSLDPDAIGVRCVFYDDI